ncbi:hypothetical protein D3C77_587910 [compost metagenome]
MPVNESGRRISNCGRHSSRTVDAGSASTTASRLTSVVLMRGSQRMPKNDRYSGQQEAVPSGSEDSGRSGLST